MSEAELKSEAAAELQAEVSVYRGDQRVAKYSIGHGEYLIGSDVSCPIYIEGQTVARHHARLTFTAFDLVIEDLVETSGVFIDGVPVRLPTLIRLDQEVQIGESILLIKLRAAAVRRLQEALEDKDLGLAQARDQIEGKKYKVITTVASGGMGTILQARDLRIRRTVAMKVMKSDSQFSRENVLRFIDEAQLTGQLEHPNIVPVYELGTDGLGQIFYTMKFVRGKTLKEVLNGLQSGEAQIVEKYSLGTLLTIFQKVCDAVAFAHAKGVVHRDLKPENIMIGSYGEVLVMDWGLAKNRIGDQRESGAEQAMDTVAMDMSTPVLESRGFETMHGLIVGTPPYISPEQACGELGLIDERSDIYVLGSILYHILTLRSPVTGETVHDVVEKIVAGRIEPPQSFNQGGRKSGGGEGGAEIELVHCPGKRIPEGLSAVVMKAMQMDPADRYQHVEDLQAEIVAYQGGYAPKAENAGLLRRLLLFAGRHKATTGLLVVSVLLFIGLTAAFIIQLTRSRDQALASEQRAIEQGRLADSRLAQLQGTAPTYASEAQALINARDPVSALEKIDYAIEQVPNQPNYHNLRGNILQAQMRLEDAIEAYEEALRLNPELASAKQNLELCRQTLKKIGHDEQIPPVVAAELYAAVLSQGRTSAAEYIMTQFGVRKQGVAKVVREALARRGIRPLRFETNPDDTVNVTFGRAVLPDFSKLAGIPVSGLTLDDTKLNSIEALRGLALQMLSLNRTMVSDLSPLANMPLHVLAVEGCPVSDLGPLRNLPLLELRLSNNTKITDLSALKGSKLERLVLSGCRGISDLTALGGLPLDSLWLNRTKVSDLGPLRESPLRELNLEGCTDLQNLEPLMDIMTLESLVIPIQCKDIEFLRHHPSLKRLSYVRLTQPTEEFWAQYDEAKKAAKQPKSP